MRIHRSYWNLPKTALHAVVAIGNFDGVHRGHRALIARAREQAQALGAQLGVITFEPHPREVLTPDQAPPRLTPFRVKARLLAELGVEQLFALAFTEHLRRKTPAQFVHDVLAGGLGVRQVVVGYDFRFGNRRAGDAESLAALGKDYGFGVTRIEPVAWAREVCSSSRVRAAIAVGDVALARELLAHPFLVEGRVVEGDRRGRPLGYPTANLRPPLRPSLWPAPGIYAVRARCPDETGGDWLNAVASLGFRPTFGGRDLRLEVHLFDREVDLYGRRLCCAFVERLRAEAIFESIEALKAQMAEDCRQAQAALAADVAKPHMALTPESHGA
ncbi:MAG TPA: bifunctional riboflavin kinase/FAD synthetase [Geminicoccaceae bacterium]|jgi:riboflavin kinase/FMN adenylyltransferase|nr:bifunctional riboflavin kinase/FAD synthetase [Geminicoccaceae bacterium]